MKFSEYKFILYYVFLVSKESYSYKRFENEQTLMDYISTPHSQINIASFVLDAIDEEYTIAYGAIDDSIFDDIKTTLMINFNQEILTDTSLCAHYSNNFHTYVNKIHDRKPK
jgi:hypothetical protein